jgi:hypothetical protein
VSHRKARQNADPPFPRDQNILLVTGFSKNYSPPLTIHSHMATTHKQICRSEEVHSSASSMLAFINRYFSHLVLEGREVIGMEHLDGKQRLLIFVIEMGKWGNIDINLQC